MFLMNAIVIHDLSQIKPHIIQKVLCLIRLSEDKNVNFVDVKRRAEEFSRRSDAPNHAEIDSDPRVTENKITSPFLIDQTDPYSRYFHVKTFVI